MSLDQLFDFVTHRSQNTDVGLSCTLIPIRIAPFRGARFNRRFLAGTLNQRLERGGYFSKGTKMPLVARVPRSDGQPRMRWVRAHHHRSVRQRPPRSRPSGHRQVRTRSHAGDALSHVDPIRRPQSRTHRDPAATWPNPIPARPSSRPVPQAGRRSEQPTEALGRIVWGSCCHADLSGSTTSHAGPQTQHRNVRSWSSN